MRGGFRGYTFRNEPTLKAYDPNNPQALAALVAAGDAHADAALALPQGKVGGGVARVGGCCA